MSDTSSTCKLSALMRLPLFKMGDTIAESYANGLRTAGASGSRLFWLFTCSTCCFLSVLSTVFLMSFSGMRFFSTDCCNIDPSRLGAGIAMFSFPGMASSPRGECSTNEFFFEFVSGIALIPGPSFSPPSPRNEPVAERGITRGSFFEGSSSDRHSSTSGVPAQLSAKTPRRLLLNVLGGVDAGVISSSSRQRRLSSNRDAKLC